jgi:hypothetical protein
MTPGFVLDGFGRPLFVDGSFPKGRLSCASVIDTALATADTPAFLAALSGNLLFGGAWATDVSQMSRDVRMLYFVEWILWARKYPRSVVEFRQLVPYSADLERWLDEHAMVHTARYVRELFALYPNSIPIEDELARGKHLTAHEKANPTIWKDFRDRYPMLEDELGRQLRIWLERDGGRVGAEADAVRTRLAEPMPRSLPEIVAATATDDEFLEALLAWLDAPLGRPALGFDRQPATGLMLWTLYGLHASMAVDGTTHFLLSYGVGKGFSKLAGWAKKIGATTTVAYAKDASAELKRLNGGKLPPMGDANRIKAIRALERADEANGGAGLFLKIDESYGPSVAAELPARIRAYVTTHLAEIERELLDAAKAVGQ